MGVLALELFVVGRQLFANEFAPRVHNSGHWTIEGADPSQFTSHIRAITGRSLPEPRLRGYAGMVNLIGKIPDAVRAAFGWPGVQEHHDFDIEGRLLPDGIKAIDWGNLEYSESDFAANRNRITRHVEAVLASGALPIVIGGDDSVPIPVLQAYRDYGPLTILQLDAHIDWRDEVNGETMGLSSNMRRASEMDWVENIVQVGARGIGSARPGDRQDAIDWGVEFFPMREVVRDGIDHVVEAIPEGCNLYIALDIDVMDPAVVPAVIGPAPGGFSYWQLLEILEAVSTRARRASSSRCSRRWCSVCSAARCQFRSRARSSSQRRTPRDPAPRVGLSTTG